MPSLGPDGKRLSGNKQRKRKQQRQEADRSLDEADQAQAKKQLVAYRKAVRGKRGIDRQIAIVEWAQDMAVADERVKPEYAREQVLRGVAPAAKIIDPNRLLRDMDSQLALALKRIQALKVELRAARQQEGDSRSPGEGVQ